MYLSLRVAQAKPGGGKYVDFSHRAGGIPADYYIFGRIRGAAYFVSAFKGN